MKEDNDDETTMNVVDDNDREDPNVQHDDNEEMNLDDAAAEVARKGEERQCQQQRQRQRDVRLDCYPYTFTPLLLFTTGGYFDKGYSNYHSVASFFQQSVMDPINVDMLSNVLCDRKNMLYEDLFHYVVNNQMLVTCCIDSHFTAFCVLKDNNTTNGTAGGSGTTSSSNKKQQPTVLYYDPCSPSVKLVTGDSAKTLILFLLLKCNYGDSQHIQDHKDYYTENPIRRNIYNLWKRIHSIDSIKDLYQIKLHPIGLNLNEYLLINQGPTSPTKMSTQLTSNTCYFQVFLFAVLCKVCQPTLNRNSGGASNKSIDCPNVPMLQQVTVDMCRHLLTFFCHEGTSTKTTTTSCCSSTAIATRADFYDATAAVTTPTATTTTTILRPLTNSNLILDFCRYLDSPYYTLVTQYLKHVQQQQQQQQQTQRGVVPMSVSATTNEYDEQYDRILQYYVETKCLHTYRKFTLEGAMASTANTKQLQAVYSTDDADTKLASSDYYKYRPTNLMFGFNAGIIKNLDAFCQFNALRKNQLLAFYDQLEGQLHNTPLAVVSTSNTYRDYYFMPQFEIGQEQLVNVHHYLYLVDLYATSDIAPDFVARIQAANEFLVDHIYFSTQKSANYDKMMSPKEFRKSKQNYKFFKNAFLTVDFMSRFIGLGFAEINPKEKDINCLTQTVFYAYDLMQSQANRQSYEFEKECINQMARSNHRAYIRRFQGGQVDGKKYKVRIPIGVGYTYSKYNTLMHFLSVVENYWNNPDLSNVQVFGKDIRVLLAISSQKIFFDERHCGYYHYGPFEISTSQYRDELDLSVASTIGFVVPEVSSKRGNGINRLVVTDRIFEFNYLRRILEGIFSRANGARFKADNEVLNLCLLSLMLDFGLYQQYVGLLNVPFLQCLQHQADTRELQVEIANLIYEFDRKNTSDSVTRSLVEELIFETSYKFMVNKDFRVNSREFNIIRMLNADPDYQSYVLLCKIYMSLCQINKSVEVDYYKVHCDGEFRIIIPQNFSKRTSNYLDDVTQKYTFTEQESIMVYDDLPIFDLRPLQPEINLYKIRFDSATDVQSMVKYIEIANAFHVLGSDERYLVFVADNVLLVDASGGDGVTVRINKIAVEMTTVFFNKAISFIPCFKYAESEDVVLFSSRNIHYMVDKGGQFHVDYYGMRHELIDCIKSEELFVDLNDEHVFKTFKLSELLTESKTVIHFPDYLLQVSDRQQLINLLDLAIHLRNVSFFILVLFYLRRGSVKLEYIGNEGDVVKISGPWRAAILYVLNKNSNAHYDSIFEEQFFDLNQFENMPLDEFIEVLCSNFTKYQRWTEDGEYEIVPRPKQKEFLKRIIGSETPMHFSEVGSGKTKVIMPLLCQIFLSNNAEAHRFLARSGKSKDMLVILVPEHLVSDARTQVFRYCLNLNFRQDYRVLDDIFALMHDTVKLNGSMKLIFVTSFNHFKKSLTYDKICRKVYPHREHVLVVADEVDDFLDRNKLVFNICSNKSNAFDRPTLDLFFEASRVAYLGSTLPDALMDSSSNPDYWKKLVEKFRAINVEIQDASRSINRRFGIFNEQTLRHCSTNISQDIEGYKGLIARPYESVNRAMPGSYYSDVERTIYLTYVILTEDIAKYDELFQAERKFISFEYWNANFIHQLDFDDLVYGHEKLSEIVAKHPETKDGLSRYLYEIILRRMETRDKSRSVNSIDVVFNFDCIGFTGTPFLDNYPTFDYIRHEREDDIPDLIDRSFYAYTSEALSTSEFEERFTLFQGENSNVDVEYVSSNFIRESAVEMETLESIISLEERRAAREGQQAIDFNCIVDLCGIFKTSTIQDIALLLKQRLGSRFDYLYHIDPATGCDRVLCINSDNDVQYDEEFYRYLCKTYGAALRDRVFFFVDNRNVIGKDIPFQLVHRRHYGVPLFTRSIVLAHDVNDFSKIWQAMGRSRTMNDTLFSIYKSGIPSEGVESHTSAHDIKQHDLTRRLYVHNCDCKMAGNISSIYLTLVALYNLSQQSFYYCDEIVNSFLEKMEKTIGEKVASLEDHLAAQVLGQQVPARIFQHILIDKFRRSASEVVARSEVTDEVVEKLLRQIVEQKFEQREPSNDIYDDYVTFLSGEQRSLMEISYTKQQQKQKQKQQNKNQDSDAMGMFDKENRLNLSFQTANYFEYSRDCRTDLTKIALNLPSSVPILTVTYIIAGVRKEINVYPTLQFLYSHHIRGAYICDRVKAIFKNIKTDSSGFYRRFLEEVDRRAQQKSSVEVVASSTSSAASQIDIKVDISFVRQNPQFTIVGLCQGVYIIGMKDQFNAHSVKDHPLRDRMQYGSDEMGFILFDRTNEKSVDCFGPYFIEQYILMEVLSKQEVAQNVMDYYCNHKETLQRGLDSYDEVQGKGFICWRFLINETAKAIAALASKRGSPTDDDDDENGTRQNERNDPSTPKRPRASDDEDANVVADGLAKTLLNR